MKHLVFIVNPKSGVERNKQIEDAIDRLLNKERYSYEIKHTERVAHGEEIARKAATDGAFAVVAVGGDGSVNDVVRGLYGSNTALAIIPKGSGNGLARTLSIPMDLDKSIEVINSGIEECIDLGKVNESIFASNAGVGYDALICKKFASSEKRGLSVYIWLITKYLWLYNDWIWEIEIDGKKLSKKAFFISVANGKQFGYNFTIAEHADWTDGLLDVVIIKKFPKILGAILGVRMLLGKLSKSPFVEHYTAKEIVIRHPKLKWLQKDGDPQACSNELHFSIIPKAINVIVGKPFGMM